MIEAASGIDNSPVISTKEESKGISNSTTLEEDLDNKKDIYHVIDALCDNLAIELRGMNKYASVIAVSLRDTTFHTYSHQRTLTNATNRTDEIIKVAHKLLDEMWQQEPIRLVGVRLNNFVTNSNHQISLFESIDSIDKNEKLDKTVDDIKHKYGTNVLKKASLVDNKITKKY
jgi:DNA polymerase-4